MPQSWNSAWLSLKDRSAAGPGSILVACMSDIRSTSACHSSQAVHDGRPTDGPVSAGGPRNAAYNFAFVCAFLNPLFPGVAMRRISALVVAVVCLVGPFVEAGENWPQWRGP